MLAPNEDATSTCYTWKIIRSIITEGSKSETQQIINLDIKCIISGQVLADVKYQIDLVKPEHHIAQVSGTFPEVKTTDFKVNLPVWRTGKYQVLPLADGVRLFSAKDNQGHELPWKRTASGEWQVALTQPTSVTVSYQLYANELGQRFAILMRATRI